MAEHQEEQREQQGEALCAAMLGSLGLYGNSLIQLAASIALAESAGARLVVPERWHRRFGVLFCGGGGDGDHHHHHPYRWRPVTDAEAWSLPIVSDRVVLSHPGFRAWCSTREPYLSLAREAGDGGLSGRQLRRLFPQATVAHVLPPPASSCPSSSAFPRPELAGRGLWGWFQWPTGALAPCASRLLLRGPCAPLRLRAELCATLDAAADALVEEAAARTGSAPSPGRRRRQRCPIVVAHVRRGDCAGTVCAERGEAAGRVGVGGEGEGVGAPPPAPPVVLRTEPPFEVGTGEAWDDQGLCWRTPVEWLRLGLGRAVAEVAARAAGVAGDEEEEGEDDACSSPPPPVVVICTDDPQLARDPGSLWPGAVTWSSFSSTALQGLVAAAKAAVRACRGGSEGGGGGDSNQDDDDDDDNDDVWMLLDWRLMQRADALLISNSTFSFTAAMLREAPPPLPVADDDRANAAPTPPLFLRPCPVARAFVPFDPWDGLPLLPSRPNLPKNHGAVLLQRGAAE
jgi:hypothetical protein